MTLIAATELFSIPVLIGDVLLSGSPPGPGTIRIPTQPPDRLLDSKTTWNGLLPRDIGRKVYIVSHNFAIAFAGEVGPAACLLERVYNRFAGRSTTIQEWRAFITAQPKEGAIFTLVGWVVETDRRSTFRWHSAQPSQLDTGDAYYEGSGTRYARLTFREPESYTSPTDESIGKATLCSLDCISQLIAFEFRYGVNLSEFFGLCYEAVLFAEDGFKYIDDVNYLHFHYKWDVNRPDVLDGGIARFGLHYKCFDEYACFTINNHQYEPHVDGAYLIPPVFGPKSPQQWSPSRIDIPRFDAQYFCNFIFVDASDGANMNKGFVVERGSPFLPFEYEDQGTETYLQMKPDQTFTLEYYLRSRRPPL